MRKLQFLSDDFIRHLVPTTLNKADKLQGRLQRLIGRLQARSERALPSSKMRNSYYVVTVPAADASSLPSILLTFDDKKYLFNCGENTQRQLLGQKLPMRKIKAIFTTGGWQSHAGLPGFMLSIHDSNGLPPLSLHGPQGLAHYLASLRAGQQRAWQYESRAPFAIEEYGESGQVYEDGNVRIVPLRATASEDGLQLDSREADRVLKVALSVWTGRFLEEIDGEWRPSTAKRKRQDATDEPSEDGRATITLDQIRAFQRYLGADLPRTRFPDAAISYWIQAQDLPGRFDVARAKALGVPPGPQYGLLQRGRSVTTADGVTVRPEDVLGPSRKSAPVLLVHCPAPAYIPSLVAQDVWPEIDGSVRSDACMIHCAPLSVLEDERYRHWAESYGCARHLVSNDECTADSITNAKAASYAADMQQLTPGFSRPPHLFGGVTGPLPEWLAGKGEILARTYEFTPFPQFKATAPAAVKGKEVPEYRQLLAKHGPGGGEIVDSPESDMVVTCLGTGSAGPSSYRNVSGTHVQVSADFGMLLDCGEGTLGQLRRAFGERFEAMLRSLRVIYLSHMHADHHLGLVGLVQVWQEHNRHADLRLVVLCPGKLGRSLLEYGSLDPSVASVATINTYGLLVDNKLDWAEAELSRLKGIVPHIERAVCVPTPHSERATCVRFDFTTGESLAYSGDTRPLDDFVELGAGVTCLVHEATLGHDKLEEAIVKRHSTLTEALDVSRRMDAKSTILTHISQRYPKFPVLTNRQAVEMRDRRVVVAHDNMQVELSKIGALAAAQPRLRRFWLAVDELQNQGKLEPDEEVPDIQE